MERLKQEARVLATELNSVLDEVEEVEDDRDHWDRQVRVASARARSLEAQRLDALSVLRSRCGGDAVERAAFVIAEGRGRSSRAVEGRRPMEGRRLPLEEVLGILRIAYEPDDGVQLTTDAALKATKKCGIDVEDDGGVVEVSLEELCMISGILRRSTCG